MKTMQDYELRCTKEQTRRAYALGAPIEREKYFILDEEEMLVIIKDAVFRIPTTQQMIGWLRENGLKSVCITYESRFAYPVWSWGLYFWDGNTDKLLSSDGDLFDTYEQAVLAAIDAVLDYLEKGGTK